MSKETTPKKIGTIRFTDKEKEMIAIAVESDFFKLIEKLVPKRIAKISITTIATAPGERELFIGQGKVSEASWLTSELRRVADEYNKTNLDPDTE